MTQDLFADDNTCLVKAKNITDLITLANSEISNLQKWYNSNLLLIHPLKTKCLLFHPPRTAQDLSKSEDGNYYIPVFLNLNNFISGGRAPPPWAMGASVGRHGGSLYPPPVNSLNTR